MSTEMDQLPDPQPIATDDPRPITKSIVMDYLPDARRIEIDNLEYIGCLAALYHTTWTKQQPELVFVTHKVDRDHPMDTRASVEVREYITALEWTVNGETPSFLLGLFKSRGVLVRDEYRFMLNRIWEIFGEDGGIESGYVPKPDIEKTDAEDPPYNPFEGLQIERSEEDGIPGVVVCGTPGIGKSMFLLVVLALRLLARQSTVYQYKPGKIVIFHDTGVFYSEKTMKEFYFLPQHTWFLVDSNEDNHIPPTSFLTACNSSSRKVVMAASPRENRFTFIRKHMGFRTVWMDPFSLEEYIAARRFQSRRTPLRERDLEMFFRLYGPSARDAYTNAETPEKQKANVENNLNWEGILKTLKDANRGYFQTPFSRCVLIAKRQGKNPQEFYVEFTSSFVAGLVYDAFAVEKGDELYRRFLNIPKARAAAGGLLEAHVLTVFPLGGQWLMRRMKKSRKHGPGITNQHWRSDDSSDVCTLLIGHQGRAVKIENGQQYSQSNEFTSVDRFDYTQGPSPPRKERGFYVPTADNQASSDAWMYEPDTDHTVILHVTLKVNSHDIKPEGLKSLGSESIDLVVVSDELGGTDVNTPFETADLIDNVYRLEY